MAKEIDNQRLDEIIARSRSEQDQRDQGYREQALKMYPWVCGRCSREFDRSNLRELTVHHRDHNHDNNPEDGSNWELLCVYCHDNEHSRHIDQIRGAGLELETKSQQTATHQPFANLKDLFNK